MNKNPRKRCPRCDFKCDKEAQICNNCGLIFARAQIATNKEAKKAIRLKEKERLLYVNNYPQDINKVSFWLLYILLGWFGGHNFYIGRYVKAAICLISTNALITLVSLEYYGYWNFAIDVAYDIISLVCGGSILSWAFDGIKLITKSFKFPVSLPYDEKEIEELETLDKIIKRDRAEVMKMLEDAKNKKKHEKNVKKQLKERKAYNLDSNINHNETIKKKSNKNNIKNK